MAEALNSVNTAVEEYTEIQIVLSTAPISSHYLKLIASTNEET